MTVAVLEKALALHDGLLVVARKFGTDFIYNHGEGHLIALRQRLYESLDDGRSGGTVAGERQKLARVEGARRALDRLAFVCREEIIGREETGFKSGICAGLSKTGALGREIQRLYDALAKVF
jgi:hypothetical protein